MDLLDKAWRDMANRARGTVAEARHGEQVDDETLVARVHAKVGRAVSPPRSIEVTAHQGCVTLRGPVLAREVPRLLDMVQAVRGVQAVDNQLEVHQQADNVPGLQGEGTRRPGEPPELLQTNWTPAIRVLMSAAGGALAFYGLTKRPPFGVVASLVGVGLAARAMTNLE